MKVLFAVLILVSMILVGCTEQERVKAFGGTMQVNLPPNQKLVLATWKETNLWYLTRPMSATDTLTVWTFTEQSSLGFAEGTVIFRESK